MDGIRFPLLALRDDSNRGTDHHVRGPGHLLTVDARTQNGENWTGVLVWLLAGRESLGNPLDHSGFMSLISK